MITDFDKDKTAIDERSKTWKNNTFIDEMHDFFLFNNKFYKSLINSILTNYFNIQKILSNLNFD